MIQMDIQSNIADTRKGLDNLGVNLKGMTRSLLSGLANAGKKWIKSRMYGPIHRMTGGLSKSMKTALKGTFATITSSPARISEPLERGAVIKAKKSKYLTFRGSDGTWKKMHQVTIPAKNFFSLAANGFEGSSEFGAAINKSIDRAIARAWK